MGEEGEEGEEEKMGGGGEGRKRKTDCHACC